MNTLASVDYLYALAAGAQDMLVKLHAQLDHHEAHVEKLEIYESLIGVNRVTEILAREVARLKEEKKRADEVTKLSTITYNRASEGGA